jgi:antitoxin MazE
MIQCIYVDNAAYNPVERELEMRAQMLKWGNSLAVRIPKPIADEAKLRVGDPLEIEVSTEGAVHLHRVGKIPTLAALVSRITPENRYEEIPAGRERAKESVEW